MAICFLEVVMATLKKRRCTWYARVRAWNNTTQKQREVQIPLQTPSNQVALERLKQVNQVEQFIKDGTITDYNQYFPWLNNGESVLHRFSLEDAVSDWMIYRKKFGIRSKTLEINRNGLDHLLSMLKDNFPLEAITDKEVYRFVDFLKDRGLSHTSINMHLRTLKAMLNHFNKRGKVKVVPLIEQLPVMKDAPIYITEMEFSKIQKLDWLSSFLKEVFYFYQETGCRLREPLIAKLEGEWLDIPNLSKGKRSRHIRLTPLLITTFIKLEAWIKERGSSSDTGKYLSKQFKKALRAIGADESKHFHSLRHTFAVRSLLKNVPIFTLQQRMGHSSVTTTEVYAQMDLQRIEQDFPSLIKRFNENPQKDFRDTQTRDTQLNPLLFSDGRIAN